MQFFKNKDVTLHYQLIGAPEGKPAIVFSNSLGTDFRIWRDVIMRLVGDYQIVLYDKRGHGLSDVGQTPYQIDDHIGDLEALMDLLKLKNAIICGLSVGGLIAQGLYQKRPDLVRALILADTAAKIGSDDLWNDRIAKIEAGGLSALTDGVMERWFTEAFRRADNHEYAGYRNMFERTPQDGYTGTAAAIRDCDYTEEAKNITVPTMMVVGEDDGATPPELVLKTARLIPEARYQPITKCAHLPCIEKPVEMADIIKAFIEDVVIPKTAPTHH